MIFLILILDVLTEKISLQDGIYINLNMERRMRMYKSKRNNWYNRAKREWRKNSDMYLTQFFLIFFVGAWAFAVVTIGVN